MSQTAEHDEVELGPLDEPTSRGRGRRGDRRLDPRDAPRRGRVGGRGGPAAQARRRGVTGGANRDELTPLAFLRRSARPYPATGWRSRDGERDVHVRASSATAARRSAAALLALGVGPGERVAVLALNRARAARGALRRARRAAASLCADQHAARPRRRCATSSSTRGAQRADPRPATCEAAAQALDRAAGLRVIELGDAEYEALLESARRRRRPTGRTTRSGRSPSTTRAARRACPRASLYTHRGAYLERARRGSSRRASTPTRRYLWTLPMFHCNGWCYTVGRDGRRRHARRASRRPDPAAVWRELRARHHASLRGADRARSRSRRTPTPRRSSTPLTVVTAGAPPSPTVIGRMEALGSAASCTSTA